MALKLGRLARSAYSRVWTAGFLYSQILIPLGVMSIYFAAAALTLPPGVNQVFVTRSATYAVPITVILWLTFIGIVKARGTKLDPGEVSSDQLDSTDLIVLLLPLAPVVQYLISNRDIISWLEGALVFSVFALLGSIATFGVPIALGRTGAARAVMYLGMAFSFSITNMASLSSRYAWHERGSLKIQLPVFAGIWLLGWLVARFGSRSLLYLVIVAYFSANSVVQLNDREDSENAVVSDDAGNQLVTLIDSRQPVINPSIYLLVYDGYVGNETLAAYGIDNQDQTQYLEELDFKIYPQAYSVGHTSLATMSRVLESSIYYGDANPRKAVSGDGAVPNLLKEFGYRTYGVFPTSYFFRGTGASYDHSFPEHRPSAALLIRAILEGEFRFDVGFDEVPRVQFIQEKNSVLSEVSADPRFLYTHSDLPGHSQNSGTCLPNEVDLYGERLVSANLEMRGDIESILENDPTAIVIVAGDHGPYLTKNCTGTAYGYAEVYPISEISRLDIQDRLGTFLAVRWPSAEFEEYDDILVLQDLFPAIFAYIFEDPSLLEARVEPTSLHRYVLSGVTVENGLIVGGINNGEPLFLDETD